MTIEDSVLYQTMVGRLPELSSYGEQLRSAFVLLRSRIREEMSYVKVAFPEFTPHDEALHLENLFSLADRVLGTDLYDRINAAELVVLVFGLYSHDWGMAVSQDERNAMEGRDAPKPTALLSDDQQAWQVFQRDQLDLGRTSEEAWREHIRRTHGRRSAVRLREQLTPLSAQFADAVARLAEGHTRDMRDIRDTDLYPTAMPILGQPVNLAALAIYIRIVDLLDIGDTRTPYALWKFVAPRDPVSKVEWGKHRALSAVTSKTYGSVRHLMIGGITDDSDVYAHLEDLRAWIDNQFSKSITLLLNQEQPYRLNLDSRIDWSVKPQGFMPIAARFEFDRERLLDLLVEDIYSTQEPVFIRELLQNSVDAIDTRKAVLSREHQFLRGEINVSIKRTAATTAIEWFDNGIGMDATTIRDYFAEIGRSWYGSAQFAGLPGHHEPISRFGIGILSCFLVAEAIEVETRLEPAYGGSSQGLIVRIPSKTSYFHIRSAPSLQVGTRVRLELTPEAARNLSTDSMIRYLRRVAGFVEHKIQVEVNGQQTELLPINDAELAEEMAGIQKRSAILRFQIRDPGARETIRTQTRVCTMRVENEDPAYMGYYSALIPNDARGIFHDTTPGFRFPDGTTFDPRHEYSDSTSEVFVRGVGGTQTPLPLNHSDWLGPKVLVNVLRTSLFRPSLNRERNQILDTAWLDDFWSKVGAELKHVILPDNEIDDEMRAMGLGTALFFGQLPPKAVEGWFPVEDTPVLKLQPGRGPVWSRLGPRADRIVEAPTELRYRIIELLHDRRESRMVESLAAWRGAPPIIVSDYVIAFDYHPAQAAAITNTIPLLRRLGYQAVSIEAVKPPPAHSSPLICRVWERRQTSAWPVDIRAAIAQWLDDSRIPHPLLLRLVGGDMPELVEFPPQLTCYPAAGSLFWNVHHPKIRSLVRLLLELAAAMQYGTASDEIRVEFGAETRRSSVGIYRHAAAADNASNAIARFNNLLALARRLDLDSPCEPLDEADFVPGSVGKVRYPTSYDFTTWSTPDSLVGEPFLPPP